jgi:NADPH:quinone reductase-like Zn-dependent oxidoreductase
MKAILFHEHGGPEVLEYADIDAPEPGPGEVQVNIQAAALNRLDIFVRNGWPGIKLEYPHIPGADGAGVVSAVGPGITEVVVSDRVVINGTMSCGKCEFCLAGKENMCLRGGILGEDMRGTYAKYVVVPENNVLKLPDNITVEAAAAGSLVFLTAWHSLITRGGLHPGETVLIVGAGGGVNTASIQIAKLSGATVYVVGSSNQKLEQAHALGADILINRGEEDWGKAVFKLTGKRGVDVVVDNVGGPTWATSIRALARGGRMLVVGGTAGYTAETPVNYIFRKHVSILGSTMAPPGDFRDVMSLIFAGKLQPVVDSVRPLAEAAEAQKLLDSGEVFGKLVLQP